MQLTYNDRNYDTIPQEEWEYIAQAVVNHEIKGKEHTTPKGVTLPVKVIYEPYLRPTDAAIDALGEIGFYGIDDYVDITPPGLEGRTWQDWRKELSI